MCSLHHGQVPGGYPWLRPADGGPNVLRRVQAPVAGHAGGDGGAVHDSNRSSQDTPPVSRFVVTRQKGGPVDQMKLMVMPGELAPPLTVIPSAAGMFTSIIVPIAVLFGTTTKIVPVCPEALS